MIFHDERWYTVPPVFVELRRRLFQLLLATMLALPQKPGHGLTGSLVSLLHTLTLRNTSGRKGKLWDLRWMIFLGWLHLLAYFLLTAAIANGALMQRDGRLLLGFFHN